MFTALQEKSRNMTKEKQKERRRDAFTPQRFTDERAKPATNSSLQHSGAQRTGRYFVWLALKRLQENVSHRHQTTTLRTDLIIFDVSGFRADN